ncbi:GerAB/ArcD/ProY family transporter [Aneurinibacillus migulanus]|uniref:Spore germination protein (Amino acid permease) n=1 Tax=Aneurinibacillus migulanus TaxID=47500 RepID=A0A0D1Y4Y4_ANEMI|nr:endospore germination permease [Aneurinibacillus migulanus]KIV59438.1 spore gernimation protein [Aneurinibacillus migulanus]KON97198.1 spore gernimation protein [Aneurinibacillus migulanus]MED0894353.1 endospore germination permease [Aneurinibacillus migulanus]MED1616437.1 endospore germination permease [Aneurinibacillus migulanus]MED4729788.1 endospore germination permease [Aneurinibacillus migulanus]
MNKPIKNEITLMQYILAIHGTQLGTGILTLPADVAKKAGSDGWISIIIGWSLTTIVSLCIVGIMSKHPGDTLLDVLTRYLGRWLGKTWLIIWVLYSLLSVIVLLYFAVLVTQVWVLPQTRNYVLVILFLIPTYMILCGGVRILARYAEFVFFFTLWIPVLLTIPLKNAHLDFMLPVLKEGWLPVFDAVKTTVVAFLGFELAFILYPYLKRKQNAAKGIVIANSLSLVVYLHITLICFLYFSPDGVTHYLWPSLTLVKPLQLPFLERFEIIFLSFYLFILSTSIIPYALSITNSMGQLFSKRNWQLPTYMLLFLFITASFFYMPTYNELEDLGTWWSQVSYFVIYAFPFLFFLYITMYMRWKRRRM